MAAAAAAVAAAAQAARFRIHRASFWAAYLLNIVDMVRDAIAQQAIAIQAVSVDSQVQIVHQLDRGTWVRGSVSPDKCNLEGTPNGCDTVLVTDACRCHGTLVYNLCTATLSLPVTAND